MNINIDVDINFLFHFVREYRKSGHFPSKILINIQKQNRLNTKILEILAWQRSNHFIYVTYFKYLFILFGVYVHPLQYITIYYNILRSC